MSTLRIDGRYHIVSREFCKNADGDALGDTAGAKMIEREPTVSVSGETLERKITKSSRDNTTMDKKNSNGLCRCYKADTYFFFERYVFSISFSQARL